MQNAEEINFLVDSADSYDSIESCVIKVIKKKLLQDVVKEQNEYKRCRRHKLERDDLDFMTLARRQKEQAKDCSEEIDLDLIKLARKTERNKQQINRRQAREKHYSSSEESSDENSFKETTRSLNDEKREMTKRQDDEITADARDQKQHCIA